MNQTKGGRTSEPGVQTPGAVLLVKSGFYEGLEVPLERGLTVIGRGRGADLVLAEPTISREHAVFGLDANGWYVEDLGSTNGSYVNGSRFERHALKQGDQIVMGKLVVEISLSGDR